MSAQNPAPSSSDSAAEQAARWLARVDRGLTAAEQDDYLQWLGEDPLHAAAIARHEATLRRMTRMAEWQPAQSTEPNPDLFAPPRYRRRVWLATVGLGAAAAVAVTYLAWWRVPFSPPRREPARSFLRVNERQALPDGSVVELKDGTRISTEFTAAERRVRLTGEEAHFVVAKNPRRPFLVEAGGVTVRAVGTAFDVRIGSASVNVLVVEGKVRISQPQSPRQSRLPQFSEEQPVVAAGQSAAISRSPAGPAPEVKSVTSAEIRDMLAWRVPRLQFNETPLRDAVAEFNSRNRLKLVLADSRLGSIPIGGTFRTDNVEGFVRLLRLTVGIRGEPVGTEQIVLRSAP